MPSFPVNWRPTASAALALSRGLERDRGVDETGHQIAVFGRIGARPFNLREQQKLYLRDGWLWRVSDDPTHPLYTGGVLPMLPPPRKVR